MNSRVDAINTSLHVAEILRKEILTGQLGGGVPVREYEVAKRLGVSRTPIREAIGTLVAEGLLTKHGNRTAHVFQPSLDDLREIYEIRIPLESLAARLACETWDEDFLCELKKAGETLAEAKPGLDWSAKHEAFHLCLVRGSRRSRLEQLVRTLRRQSESYVRFAVAWDDELRQMAQHGHAEIVRLAEEGNAQAIEELVRQHLTTSSSRAFALLEEASSVVVSK